MDAVSNEKPEWLMPFLKMSFLLPRFKWKPALKSSIDDAISLSKLAPLPKAMVAVTSCHKQQKSALLVSFLHKNSIMNAVST